MTSKREIWIDYIKVIACVLVVLGHFFQSMVKAEILPDNNLYQWFNITIYYFHVPLFFICSGYLYQKYSCVRDFASWKDNVLKKAVALGIPYFVFSFATWALKTFFSGEVNNHINGLGYTLFIQPTSPYWYLYVLFFVFVVVPTIKTKREIVVITVIALLGKVLSMISGGYCVLQIYAILALLSNLIWFVIGMAIAFGNFQKIVSRTAGVILGTFFVITSLFVWKFENVILSFLMGVIACAAVFMIIAKCKEIKFLDRFAKYTFPVFLMHTLFAAPCRVILLKMEISSSLVHTVLGIAISFVGPVIAMIVFTKIKLDFLVYPMKVLRKKEYNG